MADNKNDESVAICSVRMTMFNGTHATFQVWWMRFTAFMIIHHFKAAINPEGTEEDLPTTEATVIPAGADGGPARAAVRQNSVAQMGQPLWKNGTRQSKLLESTRKLQQAPEMVQTTTYRW